MVGEPVIRMNGVPVEADREVFLEEVAREVEAAFDEWRGDVEKLREALRLAARRTVTRWTGKKPVVDVLIVEI